MAKSVVLSHRWQDFTEDFITEKASREDAKTAKEEGRNKDGDSRELVPAANDYMLVCSPDSPATALGSM